MFVDAGAQQRERKIAADSGKSFAVQFDEMTAGAAGQIEDHAIDIAKPLAKKRHLPPGFVLIAMRVELEVLLAEPFAIPSHVNEPCTSPGT